MANQKKGHEKQRNDEQWVLHERQYRYIRTSLVSHDANSNGSGDNRNDEIGNAEKVKCDVPATGAEVLTIQKSNDGEGGKYTDKNISHTAVSGDGCWEYVEDPQHQEECAGRPPTLNQGQDYKIDAQYPAAESTTGVPKNGEHT